jgi:surfeit locus 1 family protein
VAAATPTKYPSAAWKLNFNINPKFKTTSTVGSITCRTTLTDTMKAFSRALRLSGRRTRPSFSPKHAPDPRISSPSQPHARQLSSTPHRRLKQAADDPSFTSILDNPPNLIRTGRRHGPGLIILAIVPLTAFALGTWQVKRLGWKTDLIAKCEDRILAPPLPLPPRIDPAAVPEFDYRRVYATGRFRHEQEMLIGPRMRDGEEGYMVVTPLDREGDGTTVLVNRGWISKSKKLQEDRRDSLVEGEVTVEGLLREPWKKNMFTPDNRPDKGEFYFPDVEQMAALTGSQPIWVEQTMGMCSWLSLKVHAANNGSLQTMTCSRSMTTKPGEYRLAACLR